MNKAKKYIPIIIVAAFFLGIVGYFSYDQLKDVVPGKTVDGQGVVFSMNNQNYTASDLYDDMYENLGTQSAYYLFQKAVAQQAVETTDEMKKTAEENAASLKSSWQSQYGETWQTELDSALQTYGYADSSELVQFYIDQAKLQQLVYDYLDTNGESYFNDLASSNGLRSVSHILVTCADPDNPTAEEQAKMDEVDQALATQDFAAVATQYSDDTGSAASGGSLGLMDSSTSFVQEFLDAALALEEGETSGWVKSSYGYHKIKCDYATWTGLTATTDWQDTLLTYNQALQYQALWAKAQELGVTFQDETLKQALLDTMGIQEDGSVATPEPTATPEATEEASASSETTTSPEASASTSPKAE